MRRLFLICGVIYVLVFAFEGVVRYGLHLAGADTAIFVRDGLLFLPCVLLLTRQALKLRVHPAFVVFVLVIGLHGTLMYLNVRSAEAVAYGVKLLMGVLFGFLAADLLVTPGRWAVRLFALVLLATIVGVVLDKFVLSFPWEGMTTHIGGLTVDISHDWETGTGMAKRAAGFTRTSIAVAMMVPILAFIVAPRIRQWLPRFLTIAASVGTVFLTTQKGALVVMVPIGLVLLGPRRWRYPVIGVLCAAFAVADIALPIVTNGMVVSDSGGVFSMATFGMRIMLTWPDAWQWITQHEIFPLGVGMGGIGGAQRLYAFDYTNPADNLWLMLYAWFGILGLVYLTWPIVSLWRVPQSVRARMVPAAAVLAFLIGYGAVLTVLEDPLAAVFAGAAAGALWQARQRARGGAWADAFNPPVRDPYAQPALPAALPSRRMAA